MNSVSATGLSHFASEFLQTKSQHGTWTIPFCQWVFTNEITTWGFLGLPSQRTGPKGVPPKVGKPASKNFPRMENENLQTAYYWWDFYTSLHLHYLWVLAANNIQRHEYHLHTNLLLLSIHNALPWLVTHPHEARPSVCHSACRACTDRLMLARYSQGHWLVRMSKNNLVNILLDH